MSSYYILIVQNIYGPYVAPRIFKTYAEAQVELQAIFADDIRDVYGVIKEIQLDLAKELQA